MNLTDAFGPSNVALKKVKFLCAPTDKNGEDPTAPLHPEHLKTYQVKNPVPPLFPAGIVVYDQFNPTGLTVNAKKQQYLMVPAAKSLTGPTPIPTPGAFVTDHFQCYKVNVATGTPKFVPVLGLPLGEASSLHNLGLIAAARGDVAHARRLISAVAARYETIGHAPGAAAARANLARLAEQWARQAGGADEHG